jgi:hypothetical protein
MYVHIRCLNLNEVFSVHDQVYTCVQFAVDPALAEKGGAGNGMKNGRCNLGYG